MYHFSRSIYRELAPDIIEDRPEREGPTNHERVLRSCETCVERLATDWHYFARPTKTLFNDIRIYFPMSAQLRVYKTVDRYMTFARDYFGIYPYQGLNNSGQIVLSALQNGDEGKDVLVTDAGDTLANEKLTKGPLRP